MIELVLEWMPVIFALMVAGIAAGILAGLLGVGGGIVLVPVLFVIFQSLGVSAASAMVIATGTSLLAIVPTSISSSRAHYRRNNIDLALFRRWWLPMLVGVLVGSSIATRVNGLVLTALFGSVATLVALNMLLRAGAPPLRNELPAASFQALISGFIGMVSVMMGIGAGTLGVTAMTAMNVAAHRAVGTSALLGLVIALPGALVMLLSGSTPPDAPQGTVGLVNLPGFMVIVPMTILVAPLGVRLGSMLGEAALKKVFAFFLLVVGGRMLFQSIGNLQP